MRTLLVLSAALGLAGAAHAQGNTATIAQTGTTNTATSTQSGGASLDVTQGRDLNTVTATQAGRNTALLVQSTDYSRSGAPTGGHTATITQVGGDGNLIDVQQSFGTNSLGPKGAHTATLSQDGEGNRISGAADVSEAGEYDPAVQDSRSNLTATVTQKGDRNTAEFRNGNPLDIYQLGDDNFVKSTGGSDVDIDQIGDLNVAYTLGASAAIYQEGSRNEARTSGGWAGSNHTVDIRQVGSDNVARTGDPRGGTTSVDQAGDFNSAALDYGSASAKDAQRADVTVRQDAGAFGAIGASNGLTLLVRGAGNTAVVDQTLTGPGQNTATLTMHSDGGAADVMQNGVGNRATITQN